MVLRALFIALSKSNSLKKFFTHHRFAQAASRRFIAGLNIEDSTAAIKTLNEAGIAITMDFLGEDVRNEEEAREASAEVKRMLETINNEKIDGNVSIKLTQMGLGLSPDFCRENIEGIIVKARELDNFVRIDMEDSGVTQATLDIFFSLREKYDNVGIVLQSYLYRSARDAEEVMRHHGRIRLCKGAYREPKEVAFQSKKEVDANYVKITKMLLDDDAYHAIGTHDEAMIAAAKAYVREKEIPKESFEFQMLFGIRRDLQKSLVEEGYNVRVYVPYGEEWYPYFMRRLAERPANFLFLLKNLFR